MFMKTGWLIIDRQQKSKSSANKKLLTIKRKKQKTEHSSSLRNQGGHRKNLNIQNADGVGEGGENLFTGSSKKDIPRNKLLTTNRKSKRKLPTTFRKAGRSRKRKKQKMEKIDEVVEPMDQFSELPEPIIHYILSLLRCPRDVARTTVLSKKWRSISASFFFFDFDQKRFKTSGRYHTEKFITFVDNSIATKLEPMHNIQKFRLSLSHISATLRVRMDNWILAVINKDLKDLEIHVEEKKYKHYMLPKVVLAARMLTSLKLYGCKFDSKIVVDLCNLKELSIKNAHVNADVINGFIQGCPLLEDLRLVRCNGIGRLHISTLVKLTTVELHECHGLVCVKIQSPSLVTFLLWGKKSWIWEVNLAGCENLKYLTLKDSHLTDDLLQDLFKSLPCLEKVALIECDQLEQITILSIKIKELSAIRCKSLFEANIDAPNLSVLEYSGERLLFSSMDIAGLHEAKLHLQIRKHRLISPHELLNFLHKFESNGGWKLVVSSNKNVTIYEELSKIRHLSSNDLKLELIKSPMKLKSYVDNLLRMSRLKNLSLVSSSSSELLKFVKEKIMSREKDPICCTYYLKKCWLHYIHDVTIVVLEGAKIGETLQQTTFRFNWKSLNQHDGRVNS